MKELQESLDPAPISNARDRMPAVFTPSSALIHQPNLSFAISPSHSPLLVSQLIQLNHLSKFFKIFKYATGYQTWIGYVDAKSVPTYFYVQKNGTFNVVTTSIQFDMEIVNIGKAYDPISGKFTAPVSGRYFFSFVGLAGFPAPAEYTTASHLFFDVVM